MKSGNYHPKRSLNFYHMFRLTNVQEEVSLHRHGRHELSGDFFVDALENLSEDVNFTAFLERQVEKAFLNQRNKSDYS